MKTKTLVKVTDAKNKAKKYREDKKKVIEEAIQKAQVALAIIEEANKVLVHFGQSIIAALRPVFTIPGTTSPETTMTASSTITGAVTSTPLPTTTEVNDNYHF